MKETLVRARLGLDDLRRGVAEARARCDAARRELETTRRRGRLAADVGDAETVAVAARFEAQQAERLAVLERKLAAQEDELALVEREVSEMTADFRRAAAGIAPGASGVGGATAEARAAAEVDDLLRDAPGGDAGTTDASAFDALARSQDRAAREADADARLAELKRRMGR
jgi:hypothetical protein